MADYAFVFVEVLLLMLCALLIAAIGVGRMESSVGRNRDGLSPGSAAPRWKLHDSKGELKQTPNRLRPQLLLFADRSLKGYPDLVRGFNVVSADALQLETLVMALPHRLDRPSVNELGLNCPVVTVNWTLYSRYRIQRIPFAFLLSPDGIVVARGLVGSAAALESVLRQLEFGKYSDVAHGWTAGLAKMSQ